MGDLKTPFIDPAMDAPDLGGAGVLSRGNDPQIDLSGRSGLQAAWDNPVVGSMPDQETPNSVSGLPLRPNRWEPSVTAEQPPSLEDRSPGTIDRR